MDRLVRYKDLRDVVLFRAEISLADRQEVLRVLDEFEANRTTVHLEPVFGKSSCMTWIRSDNPGYSPFDGSSEYIWTCSFCGAKEEIPAPFCRFCGREYVNKEGQKDGI